MMKIKREVILLNPKDIKPSSKGLEVLGVLNPGAIRLDDGRILIYIRVIEKVKNFRDSRYFYSPRMIGKKDFEMTIDKFKKSQIVNYSDWDFTFRDGTKRLTFISHFRRVILDKNGFKIERIDKKPGFYGLAWDGELGVEDPRITRIEGKYYMTYVGLSRKEGISTYLASSEDGMEWERKGIIFGEQDKDVVLFPEKIKGKYVAFDRPEGSFNFEPPRIWIAYSKDLLHWGELKGMNLSREGSLTFQRSGAGPPPIKTNRGWLLIFHALTRKKIRSRFYYLRKFLGLKTRTGTEYSKEDIYSVWTALFDLNDPRKLTARSKEHIISPMKKHHKSFEGKKVVFPTGIIREPNGKDILLYSGFGDTCIGVQRIALKDIFKEMR